MKRKLRTKPVAEINVVPYIDVMLVLLVIFMITAPMLSQGVTVELPQANNQAIQSQDKEPLIVSVNQQGDLFLNLSDTPETPIDAQTLSIRVAAELALAKEQQKTLAILVKGDQGVTYGKVVTAMSLLKQAGADKVGLLTESPQQKGDMHDS